MTFKSDIDIGKGSYMVDGKSTLGILTMDLREPFDAIIHSTDEEEIKKFNMVTKEFSAE